MSAFVTARGILTPGTTFLVIFFSRCYSISQFLAFRTTFKQFLINSSLKPSGCVTVSPFIISQRFYAEKKVFQRTKPHCNIGKDKKKIILII